MHLKAEGFYTKLLDIYKNANPKKFVWIKKTSK